MSNTHLIGLFIAGTLLLVLFAFFMVVFLVIQKQKQNAYLLEKQKTSFTHQNEILKTKIEVQETAMREISKEVHDNIKSKLAGVHVTLKRLKSTNVDELQGKLVGNTIELIESAIQDASKISHSLNAEFIKGKGIATMLKNELDYLSISQGIHCKFELIGTEQEIPDEKSLQVYRIAQEALQNIIKHAKATEISICLDYSPEEKLIMLVHDNGVGFDAENALSFSNGEGLMNMRQRTEVLEAELDIQSAPMAGCTVTLTINITNGGEFANKDSHS